MSIGRSILVGVLAWLGLVAAALVQGQFWPRTLVGWAVTLVLGPVIFVLVEFIGELVVKGIVRLPGVSALASWLNEGDRLTGVRAVVVLALILGITLPILLLAVWLDLEGVSLTPPGLRQWLRSNFVGGG